MKKPSFRTIIISLSLLIISITPKPATAHFFPNISSIPPSLIPNATIWDAFTTLAGCRKGQSSAGLSKLKKYLFHFGYINASNTSDDFDAALESAVKSYQLNFHLPATGALDAATLALIVLPRCGCPDPIAHRGGSGARIHAGARYSFFPRQPRWRRSNLTYAFLPENDVSGEVRGVFAVAFQRWSEVAPLAFREAAEFGRADIRIGFHRGDHGDGEAFDGALGTLAHAFSPPNGILHMDGEESWVVGGDFSSGSTRSAVDLESVAVHEIGHVLGLGHSLVEGAVMYPTISSGQRKVELSDDDIMGVQELYGSNPNFNGSDGLNPRGARDTSGARSVDYSLTRRLVAGLLLLSYISTFKYITFRFCLKFVR